MQKNNPRVDIIICSKNNIDIISSCLDSVVSQSYKNWKCIIADDNSDDDTLDFVRKTYPIMKIIKFKGRGPAYNRNAVIKKSSGKYIVTLDSDAVLTDSWLLKMVDFMENNPQIGISSGKIINLNNKNLINIAGGGLHKPGIVYHRGAGADKKNPKFNQTRQTLYLCSASMIIRREILKMIGGFDSDYCYGYEDLDICWRANMFGYNEVYYPLAVSYHRMNATIRHFSLKKLRFLESRNRILTLLKNYETWSLIKYLPLIFLHFLYLIIIKNHRLSTLNAYWWNIINIQKTYLKRKRIQTKRKKTDQDIIKLF